MEENAGVQPQIRFFLIFFWTAIYVKLTSMQHLWFAWERACTYTLIKRHVAFHPSSSIKVLQPMCEPFNDRESCYECHRSGLETISFITRPTIALESQSRHHKMRIFLYFLSKNGHGDI